jgi:hypothetical protein
MTAILQGRPYARLSMGSHVNLSVAQDGHNVGDPLPDIPFDCPRLTEVVNESAVQTFIRHLAIVMPQRGVMRGFQGSPTLLRHEKY